MDLSTRFMGLAMPNPVIVSSSGLTSDVSKVLKIAEAGAGAVILKSLFEEDIAASADQLDQSAMMQDAGMEALQLSMLLEPNDYMSFVEDCVKAVDVPVIASLNCHTGKWWTDYAERIEAVGADALELNLTPIAMNPKTTAADIEQELVDMVTLARQTVKIPLTVKIGHNFSSLPNLARRIARAGANGLTLFNRYYKMDIDVEDISFKSGNSLSSREEFGPVLRWTGILSDLENLDISASTGVYSAADVIKVILAGGRTAQLCSVLYRDGIDTIGTILSDIKHWMERREFSRISDFYSLLSLDDDKRNTWYQRMQYVKAFKKSR